MFQLLEARSPKSACDRLVLRELVLEVEALGGDVVPRELQILSLCEASVTRNKL